MKSYDVKPMVQLNISTNDALNVYVFIEKLKEYSLSVKHTITPVAEEHDNKENVDFSKSSIEELIHDRFDERWMGDLWFGLMELLGKGKIDEARELARDVYEKHY